MRAPLLYSQSTIIPTEYRTLNFFCMMAMKLQEH